MFCNWSPNFSWPGRFAKQVPLLWRGATGRERPLGEPRPPAASAFQAAQIQAVGAETVRRCGTQAQGRVTGHDFQRHPVGPALAGRCKILWQSGIGVAIGTPLMQGDEMVGRVARMAQQQTHRRLGTEGRVQAPAGDETAVAQAEQPGLRQDCPARDASAERRRP
jgi:hypothetical protein